jgi:hypothetical protein
MRSLITTVSLVTALIVLASVPARAQNSNPRYNTVTLGNGGAIRCTTTSGHTCKWQSWDGDSWVDLITVTNGATPTIAFDANLTVGGEALLPFADPGVDAMFYYDNGSPDALAELTIGSGLTFSGGQLSASMTTFAGWFGFGFISSAWLFTVAVPRWREARARRRRMTWSRA